MTSTTRLIIKRRRERQAIRRRDANRSLFLIVAIGLFALVIVTPAGFVAGRAWVAYANAAAALPDPQASVATDPTIGETRIYDASGRALMFAVSDPMGDGRAWINIDDLPDYVIDATVTWEDPNFLNRSRIDLWRVGDQLWRNWTSEHPTPAEPTITGRLVRRTILGRARDQAATSDERAIEIATIAAVNRRYTPRQILEWHLNTNFYGNEAYGIEAAAQVYLGKSARDLTLDEAALLAAIPTAPEFNPLDEETQARGRQADLLRRLLSRGAITQSEFEAVINVNTTIQPGGGQSPEYATEFALYARRQAETILDGLGMDGGQLVTRGGLRIITTLDLDLYHQAECTVRAHLARLNDDEMPTRTLDDRPCTAADFLAVDVSALATAPDSGAVVILSPQTGEILAMTGVTTRDIYQPGPVIAPLVYLHGFVNAQPAYTAASMLLDIPRTFPGQMEGVIHAPANPDGEFYGPVSLRDAMGTGLIPPAYQVAHALNINDIIRQTLHPLGINGLRDGPYSLGLLERGGAVSLLDVVYTYGQFAALGEAYGIRVRPRAPGLRDHDPVAVRRIEDANGNILWEYNAEQIAASRIPVIQSQLAYMVNDILADASTRAAIFGTENILETNRQAAIINAITADRADNWTVGYTPQLVIGVHIGRHDRRATSLDGFALDGAATAWRALLEYAHERDSFPSVSWQTPPSVVRVPVCRISGMSPNGVCQTRPEVFLDAAQVPPTDTYWQEIDINTQTGQRASFTTPAARRNTVVYFVPPDEALDWWRETDRPLPPTEFDTISRPDILSSTAILAPASYDVVGGMVDIRGVMDVDQLDFYEVLYGAGPNPSNWRNVTDHLTTFTTGTSIGQWDTAGLDGIYILQLRVVRTDNTIDTGYVQVVVDNRPPTISLSADDDGQPIRYPEQRTITVTADVTDNVSVARVEFYLNGQFLEAQTAFPFVYEHTITRTGNETFTAVAYDSVGNASEAQIEVDVIRSTAG